MIVSHQVFMWFVTLMVVGICTFLAIRDASLLRACWKRRRQEPDELFGALVGLVIAAVGFAGVFKYHLGW